MSSMCQVVSTRQKRLLPRFSKLSLLNFVDVMDDDDVMMMDE
jgi:hypothetical protein